MRREQRNCRFDRHPTALSLVLLGALVLGIMGCDQTPVGPLEESGDGVLGPRAAGTQVGPQAGEGDLQGAERVFRVDERGGTFSLNHLTLSVPRGALTGDHEIRIIVPDREVGIWGLSMDPGTDFRIPALVTVRYASFAVKAETGLLRWDEASGSWIDTGAESDSQRSVIRARIDRCGYFALSGDEGKIPGHGFRDGTSGWD